MATVVSKAKFHVSALAIALLDGICGQAMAWGDEGHQVVALIAFERLDEPVKAKISAILATDTQPFKMRDKRMTNAAFETQATWADYYRSSEGNTGEPYAHTHLWHFADIELDGGTLKAACFDYPELGEGDAASDGTSDDCVVDKITQFRKELKSSSTSPQERLLALKYLLHFVGDVHQPLHAADDKDSGGNKKNVSAKGYKPGNLHHYWDTEFVVTLPGTDGKPAGIAAALAKSITDAQAKQWSSSEPKTWAMESYRLARNYAYGALPAPTGTASKLYRLDDDYVDDALGVVRSQLCKAGVRLAKVLNEALR